MSWMERPQGIIVLLMSIPQALYNQLQYTMYLLVLHAPGSPSISGLVFENTTSFYKRSSAKSRKFLVMADWAPVLVGVVLFVLLSPGLLFSFPGNSKQLEFGSMKTNGKAITIHTLLFFAIYAVLILAVHLHIYTG
ncbi:Uncharacterized protein TCM_017234 [Theobroma cacao]|uniref:Uncharacterized protein n=1 Tax=Theobroma cacao TaxID=3641 RepID=A0A061ED26_THECC|nr:Uncharacterized protein TCM_017234 [Theobroma cacao]